MPCGIPDADVTSLVAELGRPVTVAEVAPRLRAPGCDGPRTCSTPRLAAARLTSHLPAAAASRPLASLIGVTIAPEGRRMLRVEARNAETPIEKKPEWIKTRATMGPEYTELKGLVKREGLHTVCEEAGCPNIFECWEDREATFLIGGDQCTRRCDFCQIDTGKPADFDPDEPRRVAESVQAMGLRYSTVTGVARDDLPDGGAWLYAETVRQIHALNPGTGVELLIPDFNADARAARRGVLLPARGARAQPRDRAADLQADPARLPLRALAVVLTAAREDGLVTKSNLILGMGETIDEASRRCRTCTTPAATSSRSRSTCARRRATTRSSRWVRPEEFVELSGRGRARSGFLGVMSGPLVRSSYRAGTACGARRCGARPGHPRRPRAPGREATSTT